MQLKLIAVALCVLHTSLFSQTLFNLTDATYTDKGIISLALINKITLVKNTEANRQTLLQQLTAKDAATEFRYSREFTINGIVHQHYNVYYKGIEVINMSYAIHSSEQTIEMVNGNFEPLNINVTPVLSAAKANEAAKLIAKGLPSTLQQQQNMGLIICSDIVQKTNTNRLAYKIYLDFEKRNDDRYIYIDAENGNLLSYAFDVCGTNAPGTAETKHSGTQNIVSDFTGSSYKLREVRNGVNIVTLNDNNQANYATATDLTDNNNNWLFAIQGVNQIGTDAHWGVEKTLDYWLQKRNRNSYDGNGAVVKTYFHFDSNYEGANWDTAARVIYLGDGQTYLRPMVSLDVIAHEFAHGVCQTTSNISNGFGTESGALNEGFSDIWAACVEDYVASIGGPLKQKWLIHEEVTIPSPGYLRNMQFPKLGFMQSPDTYGGTFWGSNVDQHKLAGVLNKWFFLLSDGGSGTNDKGSLYNVTGLGIDKAAAIAFETEINLQSTANYAAACSTSIARVKQMYGIGSCEEVAVTKAWYAVNVGANYTSPSYSIDGNNTICSGTMQLTIPNLPTTGATVVWSSSNNSIATVSASGVVTRVGNGNVTISASVSLACVSGTFAATPKTIHVGAYTPTDYSFTVNGNTTATISYCGSNSYTFTITPPVGTGYTWTLPNGWAIQTNSGNTCTATSPNNNSGVGTISCSFTEPCGATITKSVNVTFGGIIGTATTNLSFGGFTFYGSYFKYYTAQRGSWASFNFNLSNLGNATSVVWKNENEQTISTGNTCSFGFQASIYGYGTVTKTVYMDVTGNCSGTPSVTRYGLTVQVQSIGGFGLVASPNPTKDVLNLSITDDVSKINSEALFAPTKRFESKGRTIVSLINVNTGIVVKQWNYNDIVLKNYNYNIGTLPKGIYIVQVDRNNEAVATKIIVE